MTGSPRVIPNQIARNLLLDRYGLMSSPRGRLNRQGLLGLINALGFVQLDSICTIERAHHMILSARADGYRQVDLWQLAEDDRHLFENWTHDAALLPMSNYPFWQPRFQQSRERLLTRWRQSRDGDFEARFDTILALVQANGPVKARDLAPKKARRTTGWWDWHPDKSALEFLWRTGELAVTRRDGFQKVYDLTERVVPERYRRQTIDRNALIDWACNSALERLGFGNAADIAGFWDSVSIDEVKTWLAHQSSDHIVPVLVQDHSEENPRQTVALGEHIDRQLEYAATKQPLTRLRILNPFDPLIRDRKRLSHVFGFDYRIEVFVPEAKRRFGYYVCPLLERNRMIGRIDMRHLRDRGGLVVRKIWWEPGVRHSNLRLTRLEAELDRIRCFTGANKVIFENEFEQIGGKVGRGGMI